jgi:hypothetical protein
MPELQEDMELAKTPKLNEVDKLVKTPKLNKGGMLAEKPELNKGSKLARMPELDQGGDLAITPKLRWLFAFAAVVWVTPLPPRLPATAFRIISPINLRPMAALGIPPDNVMIALMFVVLAVGATAAMGILTEDVVMGLTFTATAALVAASTIGGGEVGVRNIVALLGESWV